MSKREKKAKKARKRTRQAEERAAEVEAKRLEALLPPKVITQEERDRINSRVMQWFSSLRFRRGEPTFKNYVMSGVTVECRDPSQLRALTELAIIEQTKKLPEN